MYEQWLATTHEATVYDYRSKFIETAASLEKALKSMLLGHFINGLNEDLKVEVHLLNPINLSRLWNWRSGTKKKLG